MRSRNIQGISNVGSLVLVFVQRQCCNQAVDIFKEFLLGEVRTLREHLKGLVSNIWLACPTSPPFDIAISQRSQSSKLVVFVRKAHIGKQVFELELDIDGVCHVAVQHIKPC